MKTVLLKIDDSIFVETEMNVLGMKISRTRYINEAIAYYNKVQKKLLLENKFKAESNLVRKDSLNVLQDFEKIDYSDESI